MASSPLTVDQAGTPVAEVFYSDDSVTLHHGDCLDVMRTMPDASVDAVVTDPPYSLGFMGKSWDEHGGGEDSGMGYWLAGFIDGEGCFVVKGHTRGTYAPSFAVKLRRDDRAILVAAQRFVGAGVVADVEGDGVSKPQVKWTVQDREGCQRLVDILDKYPLRAKKRLDYATWREAVCEWTDRPRGNRWHGATDQTRMAALRGRTSEVKTYVEPPWSGNDFQDWCRLWAAECLRVLKPGGYLLAFGGSRTWHRLACGIEDAGFEMRDSIAWLYGCHGTTPASSASPLRDVRDHLQATGQSAAEDALLEGVRERGDATSPSPEDVPGLWSDVHPDKERGQGGDILLEGMLGAGDRHGETEAVLGDDEGIPAALPTEPSDGGAGRIRDGAPASGGGRSGAGPPARRSGPPSERDQERQPTGEPGTPGQAGARQNPEAPTEADSLPALRGLDRRVGTCPACGGPLVETGGMVLDPFAGSGTTGEACIVEGFRCTLIEKGDEYLPLIVQRLTRPTQIALDLGSLA